MAFAFCLEEAIPEGCGCCSSLEESLIMRTERQPLRYGGNRLQVGCEDGVPPGERTQWGCS